ncbi:MAG: hypothetical protein Q9M91_07055 [Candidatus Dojkabacteria bacterium]|nr:hypothetical protein [Candidatus Dojkabacteria bacterium]MDQ7021550.1 hypothetical protein [Candidatus Dojkabacteria bacterium]
MLEANVEGYIRLKDRAHLNGIGIGSPSIMSGGKRVRDFGGLGIFNRIGDEFSRIYDWFVYTPIRYMLKRATELGYFPEDFVAIQRYCSHEIGIDRSGFLFPTVINRRAEIEQESETFINGWFKDNEGLVETVLRINHMYINAAVTGGIDLAQLPNIRFTEIGLPTGSNSPIQELNIQLNILEFLNGGYLIMTVEEANTWTQSPNSEWRGSVSDDSQFGILGWEGGRKAEYDEILEVTVNLDNSGIKAAIEKQINQLEQLELQGINEITFKGRTVYIQDAISNLKQIRGKVLRVRGEKGSYTLEDQIKES